MLEPQARPTHVDDISLQHASVLHNVQVHFTYPLCCLQLVVSQWIAK